MDNILILGGNGFIGRNIIEKMLQEDYKIVLLNRKQDLLDIQFSSNNKIKVIEGELKDFALIQNIIIEYKVNTVIHLVSTLIPSSCIDDFLNDLEQVIIPTFKLIDYLSKTEIKFIFFSSGGTIYGKSNIKLKENHRLEPINYYGYSKLLIEDYILFLHRVNILKYIIFRPSNVYGKYQRLEAQQGFIAVVIGKILYNKPVEIWGDGKTIRDYVYVQDVAEAVTKIVKSNIINKTLNIGSGTGINLLKIIEILEKYFDRKIDVVFKDKRSVDLDKMILDIEELKSIIVFEPVEIEKGILKFIRQLNCHEREK